jgi:hypothetical protein
MFLMIFKNLLIGDLPDAIGLMVIGVALIGSSLLLRRLIIGDAIAETEEVVVKDRS